MRSPRPSLPVLIGIAVLVALAVVRTGEIRERAEVGLGEGMPAREAALARGFVLGDDDGLDPATKEDFIRAGLSHLIAVSGENVTLLALLAMPVLAAFGVPLRERLIWTIALIAVYVPLAGSGPSIQRAGVMGAAGLLATLAGRRASRLYALGLALVVTAGDRPERRGQRRLAAELRRRARHPAAGRADPRMAARPARAAAGGEVARRRGGAQPGRPGPGAAPWPRASPSPSPRPWRRRR